MIKEGNVLFNDTLNTLYLRLYGIGHLMVKDHSDSERGNSLPPLHGLLFSTGIKGSFDCNVFFVLLTAASLLEIDLQQFAKFLVIRKISVSGEYFVNPSFGLHINLCLTSCLMVIHSFIHYYFCNLFIYLFISSLTLYLCIYR